MDKSTDMNLLVKRLKMIDQTLSATRLLQEPYFTQIVEAKKIKSRDAFKNTLRLAGIDLNLADLIWCIITNCGDLLW